MFRKIFVMLNNSILCVVTKEEYPNHYFVSFACPLPKKVWKPDLCGTEEFGWFSEGLMNPVGPIQIASISEFY